MPRGAEMQYIFAQVPPENAPQQQGGKGEAPQEQPSTPPPQPEQPAGYYGPATGKGPNMLKTVILGRTALIAIIVAIVVIVAAASYVETTMHHVTTTTITTTVQSISQNKINSCGLISSPGNYTFSGDVSPGITSGTCINVSASNVNINCMGHRLVGNGPYSGIGPFSYGILVSGNNTRLENCLISNFSYGVYASPSSGLTLQSDNASYNYMSDVYLDNVQNGDLHNNTLLFSTSAQGALAVANGSHNNRIYNNTINNEYNNGIVVNSTGNTFFNNYISGSPSGFYCSAYGGLLKSNNAYGNKCFNNTACSFAQCSGFNTPPDLSQIVLSNSVNGCGSINSPGPYTLQGSINMARYLNVSNPASSAFGVSCLYIKANRVSLNCAGHRILNATTAIYASGVSNVSISNCTVNTNAYGLVLDNVNNSKIYNVSVNGGITGIQLSNSSVDFLTNVSARNSNYGIYMSGASTDTLSRFTFNNNTYGIYATRSAGNIFNGGTALGNNNIDVYATPDSTGPSYNFMTTTTCGITNTQWAPCKTRVSTNLEFTPISSCGSISKSGNYLLTGPLLTLAQRCISIRADNVKLNCQGYHIGSSLATSFGYAISVNSSTNVSIDNCDLANFAYGITAYNSTELNVSNIYDQKSGYGISLRDVNYSSILNSMVYNTSYYGISLVRSYNNTVQANNVSYDYGPGAAVSLSNSTHNIIRDNLGYSSYYGMSLQGTSQNNTIVNNNMYGSDYYDYICSNGNNPINAEHGGINIGGSKLGCKWLAVIPRGYTGLNCVASFSSNYFSFSTDQYYTAGSTCFTVYGNSTTLDCNGHTVIATNGGTLMVLSTNRSKGISVIQNCVLRGFTRILSAYKTQVSLINDTIYSNRTSAQPGIPIVNISAGTNLDISYNNISTPYYALYIRNTSIGSINNNRVSGGVVAYALYNVSGIKVNYNTAGPSSGIGFIMNNSGDESFQGNNFTGVAVGLQCAGRSTPSYASTDLGGNSCSSQFQCGWISSSSATCHS